MINKLLLGALFSLFLTINHSLLCSAEDAPAGNIQEKSGEEIVLVNNGESKYRIVVAENASETTWRAALEMRLYIYKISGALIPIIYDNEKMTNYEIIIGNNSHLKSSGAEIDFVSLGNEGYTITTSRNKVIIAGGEPRGSLYGVYGLLEEYFGCRWFANGISRIPESKTLSIPVDSKIFKPCLEYREPYIKEAFSGNWALRNRMNRNSKDGSLGEITGARIDWVPNMFAHTFERLLPTNVYFKDHPEYFSLVKGKRIEEKNQLCCTNEEVIKIVTEKVLQFFKDNPQANIISVSQNDWRNYCECFACSTLAEAEGSDMAPVLFLVNRVAVAVQKEFPGKLVDTLAYQWTRKPPQNMKSEKNVVIRLCPIECCFSHSLNECSLPENIKFAEDLRAWAKVSDRLWIWNYTTSFSDYLVPFPDLGTRGKNIRFFAENNVKGIFEQDVYNTPGGELSELSAYLNAKLLWNPYCDENGVIVEFLEGVYGSASQNIKEYINLIHDKVEKDSIHVKIWQTPDALYLTDEILVVADSLWNEAEKAVVDTTEILERVREARLPVEYAIIWKTWKKGGEELLTPRFYERLERFSQYASKAGLTRLKEYSLTPEEFTEAIKKDIEKIKTAKDLISIMGSK